MSNGVLEWKRRSTPEERQVCDEIAAGEGELVDLLRALIRFDTTTHTAGDRPREEAASSRCWPNA